ncbi:survival motor neuron protein-like isoform X1 [Stylophora pistillata]|uniref:Survival motor neuron protein n=1 Tax=Stylophora pistillata TaxID=50429 RepID=A0A2B4SYP6_STYPI|nr:survival motor neuron protein-like isoform X1 [Stylophora pistillata]PFX35031.1 Survival motor neuron protein [Stylophora pistillata]
MAANSGDVIFRVGEQADASDIWDDTALIEAYDRAINAIKNGGKSSGTKGKNGGKNRKHQLSKKKDKKKPTEQWHVGDKCRAVYSEDEKIYDAVIISLNGSSSTCVVRFCGYGNEEEQTLDDLLLPSKKDFKSPKQSGPQSGWLASPEQNSCDNEMDWSTGDQSPIRWQVSDLCLAPEQPSQHLHEAVINSFPTSYTCKVTFLRSRQRQDVDISTLKPSHSSRQVRLNRHNHRSHHHPYTADQRYPVSGAPFTSYPFQSSHQSPMNFCAPFPPPPPIPPVLLPHHWPDTTGLQPSAPTKNSFPCAPMPPPPAPVNSSDVSHDNDALASMLMAWYLSGYHTGYYQAMQNLRHSSNPGSEEPQVSTSDVCDTDTSKQTSVEMQINGPTQLM